MYMYIYVYLYMYISYRHTLKNSQNLNFKNLTKISKSNFDSGPSFSKVSALKSAALMKKEHYHGIQLNFSEKLFSRTASAK